MRRGVLAPLEAEDVIILAVAAALPWWFGGVPPVAYRAAGSALGIAAAVALARRGWSGLAPLRAWLAPSALLCAWAFVQTVPLPPAVLGVLSPNAADRAARAAAERSDPALGLVGPGALAIDPPVDTGSWNPISQAPSATREVAVWWLALLLAAFVVARRCERPDVRAAYRAVLFGLFVALAAFGLLQGATWNGKVYWIWPEPGRPFGPYINGTNFAFVMELAAPWLAGFAWSRFERQGRAALREARGLGALLAAGGCVAAGLAAQSRMAAVLIGAGLSVLALALVRGGRARVATVLGLAITWVGAAALVAGTALGARMNDLAATAGAGLDANERIAAWKAASPMLADHLVAGSGVGAFRYVFPGYLPPGETSAWLQAHNDYLELVLGGGLVAGVFAAILAAMFWSAAVRRLRASAGRPGFAPRLGLAIGIASLCIHAGVDFNHQIPANALIFVVACAMAAPVPGARRGGVEEVPA